MSGRTIFVQITLGTAREQPARGPRVWCDWGISLVSSSSLYETQLERALAQVCHTRICIEYGRTSVPFSTGQIYHYYHIIFPNAIIIIIIIIIVIIDTTIVIATVYRNLLTFSSPAFRGWWGGWWVGWVAGGGGWAVGVGGAWHSPKPVSFHQPCLIKSVSLCSWKHWFLSKQMNCASKQ